MSAVRVFQMVVTATLVACSLLATREQACASESQDARFWGRMDAISAADRQAILAIASKRLVTSSTTSRIQSVKIFSGSEVRVFFAPNSNSAPGDMGLERRGTRWHITDEHPPRA